MDKKYIKNPDLKLIETFFDGVRKNNARLIYLILLALVICVSMLSYS